MKHHIQAFLNQATRGLPRKVRQDVQDELEEHLLEQQHKFRACGDSELEATRKAIAYVGQAPQISSGLRGVHMWPKVYAAGGMLAVMLFGIGFWTLQPASLAQKSSLERGILEGKVTVGVQRFSAVNIMGLKVPSIWEDIIYSDGLNAINYLIDRTPMPKQPMPFILSRANLDSKGSFSIDLPNNSAIDSYLIPAKDACWVETQCNSTTYVSSNQLKVAMVMVNGIRSDGIETLSFQQNKVGSEVKQKGTYLMYANQAGYLRRHVLSTKTMCERDTDLKLKAGWNWIVYSWVEKNGNTQVIERVGQGGSVWEGYPDALIKQMENDTVNNQHLEERIAQRLKERKAREKARASAKT
jgi:hypothetical protein